MATSDSTSELRIVIIGKSQKEQNSLSNWITGKKYSFWHFGRRRKKPCKVVKTADIFSLPVEQVLQEMKKCVAECPPGPNVLLLLVNPSDFTDTDRDTLNITMSYFRQDAFQHSMIIMTQKDTGGNFSVYKLLRDCKNREHTIDFAKKDIQDKNLQELMDTMEKIESENRGKCLTEESVPIASPDGSKPNLNLVLFGRHEACKTLTTNAILGGRNKVSTADSSECVKSVAEADGRQVSLVELPVLYGKHPATAKKESLQCVSLCDPEGVHAFILVLPLDLPSDEDMKELETIQKTLSSQIDHFTMILFTVFETLCLPEVETFLQQSRDIQQLLQACGGRYVVLNITDEHSVSEFVHTVEKMSVVGCRSFTKDMFPKTSSKKVSKHLSLMKPESKMPWVWTDRKRVGPVKDRYMAGLNKDPVRVQSTEPFRTRQSKECLRLVLLGMTGSGKSATGNTILGKECFKSEARFSSVTKQCQKETGEIDGQPVVVVDTPGLFDTSLPNDQVKQQLVHCISLLAPGPHVFLLVVPIGRFTKEARDTVELIKEFFSKRSEDFVIVIFTGGDTLENKTIESHMEGADEDFFKKLKTEGPERYQVFNNKDKQDRSQVRELLTKVKLLVKNDTGHYISDLFLEAEAAIKREMEKIMKEMEPKVERELTDLRIKHEGEMQEKEIKSAELKSKLDQERKQKLRQFNETVEHIKREQRRMESDSEKSEEQDRIMKGQEDLQRSGWEQKLKTLEQELKYATGVKETCKMVSIIDRRKAMTKEREAWEQERMESWKKRYREVERRREEEQTRLKNLREKLGQEFGTYDNKRKEEERISKEQEEREKKDAKVNYEKKVKEINRKNEEEARRRAEDSNEFLNTYANRVSPETVIRQELEDMNQRRKEENDAMIKKLVKNKLYKKDFEQLKKKQDQEISKLRKYVNLLDKESQNKKTNELKKKHEEEIQNWIQVYVGNAVEGRICSIL